MASRQWELHELAEMTGADVIPLGSAGYKWLADVADTLTSEYPLPDDDEYWSAEQSLEKIRECVSVPKPDACWRIVADLELWRHVDWDLIGSEAMRRCNDPNCDTCRYGSPHVHCRSLPDKPQDLAHDMLTVIGDQVAARIAATLHSEYEERQYDDEEDEA